MPVKTQTTLSMNYGYLLVDLPIRTISEANREGRRRDKIRRKGEQRMVARALMRPYKPMLRLPATVKLTRLAPSNGLDDDNLRSALKHVRDGIADAFGVDDGDERFTWDYDQARRAEYGVRVEVTYLQTEEKPS